MSDTGAANNCTIESAQIVCALTYRYLAVPTNKKSFFDVRSVRECLDVDIPSAGPVSIGNLPCADMCYRWANECGPQFLV